MAHIALTDADLLRYADEVSRSITYQSIMPLFQNIFGPTVLEAHIVYNRNGEPRNFGAADAQGRPLQPDPRSSIVREQIARLNEGYFEEGVFLRGDRFHKKVEELYHKLDNDEDAGELEPIVYAAHLNCIFRIPNNPQMGGDIFVLRSDSPPSRPNGVFYLHTDDGDVERDDYLDS